jgi:hypothetical protein
MKSQWWNVFWICAAIAMLAREVITFDGASSLCVGAFWTLVVAAYVHKAYRERRE